MKNLKSALMVTALLYLCGCTPSSKQQENATVADVTEKNAVIETIMSRRSIRKYQPQAVSRDTMQIILDCGINAPNGQNRQSWEIRVVDNP